MDTIMVIDDDDGVRALLKQMLELEGYRVIDVANGNQAIESLTHHEVDLIVTDILMPEMDGVEVIFNLRFREKSPPIIAISAGGRFSRASECLAWARDMGVTDTFPKPIDRKAFLARVRELLTPAGENQ